MASITKHTSKTGVISYKVRVRLKGYPIQVSTHPRLAEARKWASDTESAIRDGRHFKTAEAKKHTLADLIERYKKDVLPGKSATMIKGQGTQLTWWSDNFGSVSLAEFDSVHIVEGRDTLKTELNSNGVVRSPATVVRYLAALSHAFTIAVTEWKWIENNPVLSVARPAEPKGRVRFLEEEERNNLLWACQQSEQKWLHTCVVLALSTGMRQAELMSLTWKDVDLVNGVIILHETKNGERRRVAVAGLALRLLREHAEVKRIDTPLLFPGINPQKPISLRRSFATATKLAGLTDFHWHDLRHCAASYLAMNGASPSVIADVLGHKTLNMVKRYAHLSDSHISSEVANMNAAIFGE